MSGSLSHGLRRRGRPCSLLSLALSSLGLACSTATPEPPVEPPAQDTALSIPLPPLELPTLEFQHPYRSHADAAIEAVSRAAGPTFGDTIHPRCAPKDAWCSISSTQPDAPSVSAVMGALRAAIRQERKSLDLVLYSARESDDGRENLAVRFILARPGQLEQERRVYVADTSRTFASRVVQKAQQHLPHYLAQNLKPHCGDTACGAAVIERSESTFHKVFQALHRACRSLHCEVMLKDHEINASGMHRGVFTIERYLETEPL